MIDLYTDDDDLPIDDPLIDENEYIYPLLSRFRS